MSRTTAGPSVTSRVLAILGTFDEEHPHQTLTSISERAALPLSTTHRLVGELVQGDVLERTSDLQYSIGRRIWQLGTLANVHLGLRELALPSMQDLYAVTHENVHLAVRAGLEALYVERIYGPTSVALVSRPGAHLPLHATGVGKVLLAHAPDPIVEQVTGALAPVTRYTITEPGRLIRELRNVRRNGYASTVEEMTLGTCSIAVPVHDDAGIVVAAIGLVTRTVRRDLHRHVPALQVAAAAVTRGLRDQSVADRFRSTE
jgi:DNA-binding IclR family transcriptional regulator